MSSPKEADSQIKQRSPSISSPPPLQIEQPPSFQAPPRTVSLQNDWKNDYSKPPPLYPVKPHIPGWALQLKKIFKNVPLKIRRSGPAMMALGFFCAWMVFLLFGPRRQVVISTVQSQPVVELPDIDPLEAFEHREEPSTDFKQKPILFTHAVSGWDDLAVAVKTGKETALKRVPVQAATLLRHVKKWILIGESGGVNVGDKEMIDVYTDLYTQARPKPGHLEPTVMHYAQDRAMYDPEAVDKAAQAAGKQVEQSLVPNQQSDGWRKDAHKNLPGFIHLWNRFPDADWYMMIDDDTYMFFANVVNGLKDLDPELPHYWGAPTMFVGCDGITRYGDGPNFAHGGSGIVMSRGAIKQMMKIVDKCIDKYEKCWAGDVRTALCLRDAGIKVGWHPTLSFNGEPPQARSWWPADPCSTPATYHHLLLPQIQKLYEIESNKSMQLVNYGDLYHHYLTDEDRTLLEGLVDEDTNRAGLDYRHTPAKNYKICSDICKGEKECKAWSWEPPGPKDKIGECWLKQGVPGKVEKKGTYSGVHMKDYTCRK